MPSKPQSRTFDKTNGVRLLAEHRASTLCPALSSRSRVSARFPSDRSPFVPEKPIVADYIADEEKRFKHNRTGRTGQDIVNNPDGCGRHTVLAETPIAAERRNRGQSRTGTRQDGNWTSIRAERAGQNEKEKAIQKSTGLPIDGDEIPDTGDQRQQRGGLGIQQQEVDRHQERYGNTAQEDVFPTPKLKRDHRDDEDHPNQHL